MSDGCGFFDGLMSESRVSGVDGVFVVTHMVPGVDDYLVSMDRFLPVLGVIPKPNSIEKGVIESVSSRFYVLGFSRDEIVSRKNELFQEMRDRIERKRFAVIDTGGYFSPIVGDLCSFFGDSFIGVVEDTENGHQKYEECLSGIGTSSFPCAFISAARSPLKEAEDYLVGHAVVFSAEAILRERSALLVGRAALVLGYGKIGSSIANYLRQKGVRVSVFDVDAVRMTKAISHGFGFVERDVAISSADMIFCATGNGSVGPRDFLLMKDGCFLFSATSGDDEIICYDDVIKNSSLVGDKGLREIQGSSGGKVFLCNNGNSVNFLHGGVVGPFIKLVQAELFFGATRLSSRPKGVLGQLSDGDRNFIASEWLRFFGQEGVI